MNNAPFHIGQRVVALKSSQKVSCVQFIKGNVYVVSAIYQCCKCKKWMVIIEGMFYPNDYEVLTCCQTGVDPLNRVGGHSKYFAPITTRAVEIDEAIKEQAEEMIGVKETVLTPVLS